MSCPARSAKRRAHAGFTLIELMIGVVIGLLASLAVTHVLVSSEGNKRTTMSASDAQVNGALALGTLQRSIQSAGYGFTPTPAVIGCTLTAAFGGAAIANFPTNLVPVRITPHATAGMPDTIRVLASGKSSFSMPLRVVAPGYKKNDKMIPVASGIGIAAPVVSGGTVTSPGDLLIAAVNTSTPCSVFRVTSRGPARWRSSAPTTPAGTPPARRSTHTAPAASSSTWASPSTSPTASSTTRCARAP
ncbi:prepilin-type N-terminal cleavage/methylation domain-containing protein [Ramlibacter terrae]|uniref:Prepilin-type N-terminal cleavage/methylation domain-containing protein n=1 Tax=Ramlibacter terrae TaxID=2732511 RepID=A0ABX6P2G7_9BURK|nr:prepilin-type N-terminal cleavage/methylation domain-containing protein [Ramlibacter terrae]